MSEYNHYGLENERTGRGKWFVLLIVLVVVLATIAGFVLYGINYPMKSSDFGSLKDFKEYMSVDEDATALMISVPKQDIVGTINKQVDEVLIAESEDIASVSFDVADKKVYARIKGGLFNYTATANYHLILNQGNVEVKVGDFSYANLWRIPQSKNEMLRENIEAARVSVLSELKIATLISETYSEFINETLYLTDEKNITFKWGINYDAISEEWYLNTYNPSRLLHQYFMGQDETLLKVFAEVLDSQEGPTKGEIMLFTALVLENYDNSEFLDQLQLLLSSNSYDYYKKFYEPIVKFRIESVAVPGYYEQFVKRNVIEPIFAGDNEIGYVLGMTIDELVALQEPESMTENEDQSSTYDFSNGVLVTTDVEGKIKSLYFTNGITSEIITEFADSWEYAELFISEELVSGVDRVYFGYVHEINGQRVEIRIHQSEETYEFIGIEFVIE